MKRLMHFIYFCYFLTCTLSGTSRSGCYRFQWQCKNGQCISFDGFCNGVINCRDQSDESSEFCLETDCPEYSFKCAYGACISGTAKCNGINDCIDNSDESEALCGTKRANLGRPGNLSGNCSENREVCNGRKNCADASDELGHGKTDSKPKLPLPFVSTPQHKGTLREISGCYSFQWQCKNGQCISSDDFCDGIINCGDQSDESSEFCLETDCPEYSFKCAYGACISGTAKCNGINDCIDNSDESEALCGTKRGNLGRPGSLSGNRSSPRSAETGTWRVALAPNVVISPEYDPSSLMMENCE